MASNPSDMIQSPFISSLKIRVSDINFDNKSHHFLIGSSSTSTGNLHLLLKSKEKKITISPCGTIVNLLWLSACNRAKDEDVGHDSFQKPQNHSKSSKSKKFLVIDGITFKIVKSKQYTYPKIPEKLHSYYEYAKKVVGILRNGSSKQS